MSSVGCFTEQPAPKVLAAETTINEPSAPRAPRDKVCIRCIPIAKSPQKRSPPAGWI
jgi:hypothetical protein